MLDLRENTLGRRPPKGDDIPFTLRALRGDDVRILPGPLSGYLSNAFNLSYPKVSDKGCSPQETIQ